MTVLVAIGFGSLIGILLGLVGGGGSILTVPILVYVLDLGVHEATATSLVIVGATTLAGAVSHARAGRVAFTTAFLFGGAGIAGAFAGTALNARVSGPVILLLLGLLMLGVAARMAIDRRVASLFVAGGVVGAAIGGRLAGVVDEAKLARGFAALVAGVGLYLIARNSAALG